MALTATATPRVREDIIVELFGRVAEAPAPLLCVQTFSRPNLRFSVRQKTRRDPVTDLGPVFRQFDGCGATIVYVPTRADTEKVPLQSLWGTH